LCVAIPAPPVLSVLSLPDALPIFDRAGLALFAGDRAGNPRGGAGRAALRRGGGNGVRATGRLDRGAGPRGPQRRARGSALSSARSEEHTSELQSRENLVCRLLLEK